MIKYLLLYTLLLSSLLDAFANKDMLLFTKDGKKYILDEESKKEGSIIISKTYKYKNTQIPIALIDSIRVDDAIYKTITYKNQIYMARLLFSGDNEGYKIYYEGEKIILLKPERMDEYILITKHNNIGVYNYLFPECFKKDTNLFKMKSNISDDNVIKTVTKTLNCQNKVYTVHKKPMKIDVYVAAFGGINLYRPSVKTSLISNVFNYDKVKPKIGYSFGGKIGFVIDGKIDLSFSAFYTVGKAKFSGVAVNDFYSVKDTTVYAGLYNNRSIDFEINFKYIILKSKLSPTFSAGFYFTNKFLNNSLYNYTRDNGISYVYAEKDLAAISLGLSIGAGIIYKPIKRFGVFMDLGYKIGAGSAGPMAYKISEGFFYTNAGIILKLNK